MIAYSIARKVETLLSLPGGFGLTLSPMQRTIARIWDGSPIIDRGEDIQKALNVENLMNIDRPRELTVLSGIRVGKTLCAAGFALSWAVCCDVRVLGPGEVPRVAVVSLTRDHAQVVFQHLVGRIEASPFLKPLLVDARAEQVRLVHPSGRHVEIAIVAGARSGSSLVARWLAGVVFDEFALMRGQEDGAINWTEARKQVANRILPGGGILNIGSPWGRAGPAYQMVLENHGKPTPMLCVVKCPAWVMHPAYWTQERCQEALENDPAAYATTVAAEFADEEESLFSGVEVDRCTRAGLDESPVVGASYVAAMDPGTRGNSWTLVVASREGQTRKVVLSRQWTGTKMEPLNPDQVLQLVAKILAQYNVHTVLTDRYNIDPLQAIAGRYGLLLQQRDMTDSQKTSRYLALRTMFADGKMSIPRDEVLRNDLLRLKRRVTQTGVSIVLPHTSDGRHCDYAPALFNLGLLRAEDPETGVSDVTIHRMCVIGPDTMTASVPFSAPATPPLTGQSICTMLRVSGSSFSMVSRPARSRAQARAPCGSTRPTCSPTRRRPGLWPPRRPTCPSSCRTSASSPTCARRSAVCGPRSTTRKRPDR